MNDNYQTNMYLFTKYINKILKDEPLVTGWAFEINHHGTYELIVSIDYIDRLHSKEMYDLHNRDIDELRRDFQFYLNRNISQIGISEL